MNEAQAIRMYYHLTNCNKYASLAVYTFKLTIRNTNAIILYYDTARAPGARLATVGGFRR